jgi:hypothetical protein
MTQALDENARALLQRAFAMRAVAYAHMFDVMRERLGVEQAMEIGMEATRRMGAEMGKTFAHLGPSDLPGLKDAFLGGIIDGEEMFGPEVVRCDADELQIYFHKCPLKRAWVETGRSDEDVALLCRFAGAIDGGLFNAAGFTFAGETWKPGEPGCCRLRVLPGPQAAAHP